MAIAAAGLAIGFGGVAAAAVGMTWTIGWIATLLQVGMYLYSQNQSQFDTSSSSPTYAFGPIQNTKTQKLPVPIVYGQMLVAGNVFYEKFKDDKCEEVDRMIGLSVGPIDNIIDVKIGDKLIGDCEGCTVTRHFNSDSGTTDPLDPPGEKPYPIDNPVNGIAFISCHLKAGEDVSGSDVVTSLVRGRKVWRGSGTAMWTANPAWCIYDLLTNTVYGCGIPASRIDLASFQAAANYYDGVVAGGNTRFRLNYVIDTQKKAIDILGDMLAVCFSSLISREKIRLVPDAPVTTYSKKIGMADIIDGSFQWTQKSENERYNRIVLEWIDPNDSYEQVVSIFEDTADQAKRGIIEQSVSMLGCTNVNQANRAGARILDTSMGVKEFCSFKMSLKNASVEVGDVIALTHDVPGWTDKWMRVIGITDVDNIEDEINVICAEYIPEVYNDIPMDVPTHIDTNIHGVYVPDNVTNITFTEELEAQSDGTYIHWVRLGWTNPNQDFSHLEMWYRFDSEANYTAGGNVSKAANEFRINATTRQRLYVKIVTVSRLGKRSSGATASRVLTGDTTPPAAPTNVVAVTGYHLCTLTWTDPADSDLDHINIYRCATTGGEFVKIGEVKRGAEEYTDNNIYSPWYYKLKAVDSAKNASVWSAMVTADRTPPAMPTDLSATGGYRLINVTWTDPSDGDLDHIVIYRSDDGVNYAVCGQANKGEQLFIDANLAIMTMYWYKVKAVDWLGNESTLTEPVSALTEAIPMPEIPDFSIDGHKTVEDIFGENEDTAIAVIEQVLNNYADAKDDRLVIHDVLQKTAQTEQSLLETMETVEGQATHLTQLDQKTDSTNTQLTSLTTTVGGHSTHLTQLDSKTDTTNATVSEVSSIVDGLRAKWYVKVNSNGKISGISLGNDSQNSDFTVLADKFFIYGNDSTGIKQVFAVDTTTHRVVLNGDLLADGSITGAKINAKAQIVLGNGGELIMDEGSILQMASGVFTLNSQTGHLHIRNPDDVTNGDYVDISGGQLSMYHKFSGDSAHTQVKALAQLQVKRMNTPYFTLSSNEWHNVGSWTSDKKWVKQPDAVITGFAFYGHNAYPYVDEMATGISYNANTGLATIEFYAKSTNYGDFNMRISFTLMLIS